ncbi:AAA family ATPase [Aeromicrobium sp.]|uniref:AAA family ATPase n=1 Tax=Aeromicrobium sp. TaxID=1871063 RepID=UPI0030C46045
MTLTPRDYPFEPYPPFKDPDDWRVTSHALNDRDILRARLLAENATADHTAGTHATADHPWCLDCVARLTNATRLNEGNDPLVTPLEAAAELFEAGISPTDTALRELKAAWETDATLEVDDHPDIPPDVIEVCRDYLTDLDAWEGHAADARTTTVGRAARYLAIHGRQPPDAGPPAPAADFQQEYLDRDGLNNLPAPEPLIDGVLTRHAYGILRGRDDSFKSFVALDWGLSLATGRTWQGHPAQTVRVLYIAGEGAYGLAARADAWEQAWGIKIPAHMLTIRRTAPSMFKPGAAFDHLLDTVTEGGYGLVIIDTLRRVAGTADGNSSEMGAVVDNIDRLKHATDNGSVLVVAHTDKGDNDSRGYSGIEDDADVVWHAKRDDTNLHLENTKMKDGPGGRIHRLHASVVGPSLVLEEAGTTTPVATESQIRLIDTLRRTFPNGASTTQLQEASGLKKSTFYRARTELMEAGHVIDTGTKSRPHFELVKSHEVPTPQTRPDLQESHRSHEVPQDPVEGPTGPTALIGETWDQDGTNTDEREIS